MAGVCLVVVCITLSLGLWPFHSPRNDVTWIPQGGLEFGKYGTVIAPGPLKGASSSSRTGGSIEVWVRPDHWTFATILSLYRPDQGLLLRLRQSLTDLELIEETGITASRETRARIVVHGALAPALQQKKPVFIAVTAGLRGTTIYVDGSLATAAPDFRLPMASFGGRLILGDSPRQPDSFRGEFRGLAIYDTELTVGQILHHYQNWAQDRGSQHQDVHELALYRFNEEAGDLVHNDAGPEGVLYIPNKYVVIDKIYLEPIWREFDLSGSYWRGNLKNIIGFLPPGFCLYAYFRAVGPRRRRAALLTVASAALVSIAIEALQGALPTRDSGTTDIVTNVFGAWLGVMCYRDVYLGLVRRFPWLGWFGSNQSGSRNVRLKRTGCA